MTAKSAALYTESVLVVTASTHTVCSRTGKEPNVKLTILAGLGIAALITGCGTASAVSQPTVAQKCAATVEWTHGAGFKHLSDVQSDLTQVATDAGNMDTSALQSDGAILTADAALAGGSPPPMDSGIYTTAMGDLAASGTALSNADYAGATKSAIDGAAMLNTVTAGLTACPGA